MKSSTFKAIISLFALILLTELFINHFFKFSINQTLTKVGVKIDLAKNDPKDYQIIVIGDSSSAHAIDANLISQQLNKKVFNYGIIRAMTMAGQYFLLEDYLDQHQPPKYILMMNVYDFWRVGYDAESFLNTVTPLYFNKIWPDLLNPQLVGPENYWKFAKIYFSYALPSQRFRPEIKSYLRRDQTPWQTYQQITSRRKKMIDELSLTKGTLTTDMVTNNDFSDFQRGLDDIFTGRKFEISKLNFYYWRKIVHLADKNDIKVILLPQPMNRDFYQRAQERSNIFSDYLKFLKLQAELYPNVSLIDDDYFYNQLDKYMGNRNHLNKKGTEEYTNFLIEKLSEAVQ